MSLNKYIKETKKHFIDTHFENTSYSEVVKIALTCLIIFNRRRPGEVSLLEVDFKIRTKSTEPQGEIKGILSKSENRCFQS